ncbi:SGNH/GDSL hydrolase family protein [Nonlabens antarcticus]|uniref:hypothetical protein n=1 Tax=Nonlabens antarcticus TaxID=392714 RepID=UPI001891B7FF|nr:hypothetical protein [Nonlabens antarcticus]
MILEYYFCVLNYIHSDTSQMPNNRPQFISAFCIIALATAVFYFSKPYLPSKLFVQQEASVAIVMDSLMQQAMKDTSAVVIDSIIVEQDSVFKDSIAPRNNSYRLMQLSDFDMGITYQIDSTGSVPLPKALPLTSYKGTEYLNRFFEKLLELEENGNGSVRIAYYGDSMIDGDLIVQDFRSTLQDKFGGNGAGFVPINSESSSARYSVKHSYSGSFREESYMKGGGKTAPYGVGGTVYFATDSSSQVTYRSSGIKNSYRLNSPVLFYGTGNETASIKIQVGNDTTLIEKKLKGLGSLNSLPLGGGNLQQLKIQLGSAQDVPLYGVSFYDGRGVTVDGYSNRGNSGLPLSILSTSQMRNFDRKLGYDLIILQYGANVLATKAESYGWYADRMERVIDHIKLSFPEADILILGTADHGVKMDALVRTDVSVINLLQAQQKYAARTQSGFMSLFNMMGGPNSMPIWVNHSPRLANTDYTHFNPKGSARIGRMISNEIIKDYAIFKKRRTVEKAAFAKAEKDSITAANEQQQLNLPQDTITNTPSDQ